MPKSEKMTVPCPPQTYYQPISLMNIDANILNKIVECSINQHTKRIIYHDQEEFVPGMQGWFNSQKSISGIHHTNKLVKKKNHMILSAAEKAFDKVQHPFGIKPLRRLVIKENFLNLIKSTTK